MSPSEITTIIGNVGFPIVACGFMGYFCYILTTRFQKSIEEMTVAITKLTESIDKEGDREK